MTVPTNVTELQTFLGMCHYLAKYSARTAELSEPLWQLTCKDTPFIWGLEHDEALKALKKEISAAPTLRYYDPCQPLVLQADACSKVLVQFFYRMVSWCTLHPRPCMGHKKIM